MGYSPSAVGLFLGFFELIGVAGPIFLARKADALGRYNPFMFWSGLAIIAGQGLLVASRIPAFTIAGIALISLGLKTPVPVLDTSLLKAIEQKNAKGEKAPNYGVLRALGSLGFVVVTLGVQAIPGFDQSQPWVMALSAIGLCLAYLGGLALLPETGSGEKSLRKTTFNFSWMDSTFVLGLAVIALGRLAMAAVNSFLSLYLTESMGWNAVGGMWALSAAVEIPMMILSWRFMRRWSPMQLVGFSSGAVIVRLLIYALFPTKLGVITGQILHSLCYGIFQPASVAFVNLKTPPSERTTGMALLLGIGIGLPAFIGASMGGLVVEWFGYPWLFAGYTVFAFASLILYRLKRQELGSVR